MRLNTLDDPGAKDEGGIYLTVSDTSAEMGDDGQVGRGNRASRLITPGRPMSLEACAGKNPVSHVGKIYNVLAHRIAHAVAARVDGIAEAHCLLLSRIGAPIDCPQLFEVRVRTSEADALDAIAPHVAQVAGEVFSGVTRLWREAIEGGLAVC